MKVYAQKNGLTVFGFDKKTYLFNYVYLYGDLELENGYDIVDTETEEEQNISEGIYDIEVVLHDGRIVPGRLYYWKGFGGTYRGFIVSPTDEEGINYVLEYYDNRMSTWEENEEEDVMVKPADVEITKEKLQILMEDSIPKDIIHIIDNIIYVEAKEGKPCCSINTYNYKIKDFAKYIDAIIVYYNRRGIEVEARENNHYIMDRPAIDETVYDIMFIWSTVDLNKPLYV